MTALNVSGPGSTLRLQLQFRGFPFGVSSGSTLAFGGWCGRRDSKGRSVGAFAGFCARRTRGQARAAQRRAAIFRCDTVAGAFGRMLAGGCRSEEHTYELQYLMRIAYAVFCLKKKQIQ